MLEDCSKHMPCLSASGGCSGASTAAHYLRDAGPSHAAGCLHSWGGGRHLSGHGCAGADPRLEAALAGYASQGGLQATCLLASSFDCTTCSAGGAPPDQVEGAWLQRGGEAGCAAGHSMHGVSGPCFNQHQADGASMLVCMHLYLAVPCCMGSQILLCCQPVAQWKPQPPISHTTCVGSCNAHKWLAHCNRACADQCPRGHLQLGAHPMFRGLWDRTALLRKSKVVEKGRHLREDLRERWETADNRVVHKIQVCAAMWRCLEGCRARPLPARCSGTPP